MSRPSEMIDGSPDRGAASRAVVARLTEGPGEEMTKDLWRARRSRSLRSATRQSLADGGAWSRVALSGVRTTESCCGVRGCQRADRLEDRVTAAPHRNTAAESDGCRFQPFGSGSAREDPSGERRADRQGILEVKAPFSYSCAPAILRLHLAPTFPGRFVRILLGALKRVGYNPQRHEVDVEKRRCAPGSSLGISARSMYSVAQSSCLAHPNASVSA